MQQGPKTYYLKIGEIIICPEPSIISTVLGSCVSVCLFAKGAGIGGMIHFAHPKALTLKNQEGNYKYGEYAIPALIRELEKLSGVSAQSFTAKIVGGASEIFGDKVEYSVGSENIKFAKEILSQFKIHIISSDVGGMEGRKVRFHTSTNRLEVAPIKSTSEISNQNTRPVPKKLGQVDEVKPSILISKKRKVLIIDDSKAMRELIKRILAEDPNFDVIGMLSNVNEARNLIKKNRPDVITLKLPLEGASGVEWPDSFLLDLNIPVIVFSSSQLEHDNQIFRALEVGAIDYIQKATHAELLMIGPLIREKVREASYAKVIRQIYRPSNLISAALPEIDVRKIIVIGASTGGTEALKVVLAALPAKIPPIIVVQHIPPLFSKAFADRLNLVCPFDVKEAEDGDELLVSRVLIAPGARQIKVERTSKGGLCVRINDDPPMNRHRPSVDYLFHSVVSVIGKNSVGVILTGMGGDGAKGLLEMKKIGSMTIAQDEKSCAVYGMPKRAVEMDAVKKVVSLENIAREILVACSSRKSAA